MVKIWEQLNAKSVEGWDSKKIKDYLFFDEWECEEQTFDDNQLFPIVFLKTDNICYYLASKIENDELIVFYNWIYKTKVDELKTHLELDVKNQKLIKLDEKQKTKCLDEIKKMLFGEKNFVILDVFNDGEQKSKAKNIFTNKEKLKEMGNDWFLNHNEDIANNLEYFISDKNSKKTWERKRYANALDFGVKFLDVYFKDDVEKFLEKEGVDEKWIEENLRGYTIRN